MKDPVTLPTSGQVVDLATIKSHLLSDSKDPFNRMPLSIDDVIPSMCLSMVFANCSRGVIDSELKFRITEFLDSRRKRRLALEESKMDVDS
jgi:ubiquitin conjugation factor E4 B